MTQPLGGCPGCGGEESFEQVHPGGHADGQCAGVSGPDGSDECPEWLCPACGAGVFIGTVLTSPVVTGPVVTGPVLTGPVLTGTVIIGTSAAGAATIPARQSVRAA